MEPFAVNQCSSRPSLRWAVLWYGVLCVVFLHYYRYHIDPDGISYISLSQKYLDGDFRNAINGLWSPLISWILVPFLAAHLDPLLAAKVVSVIVGAFVLVDINLLLSLLSVSPQIRSLYLLSLSPLLVWYALYEGCPDLLGLGILLFYIYLVLSEKYRESLCMGIACGVLGGTAYLAKSYNFYFFLLHFTCITVCHIKTAGSLCAEKRVIVLNYLAGLLIFALISGVWISLLSHKYHKLTVSTAGTYNMALNSPASAGYPMEVAGLIAPPNPTAISSLEDPTYQPIVPWNPMATRADQMHLVHIVVKNVFDFSYNLTKNPIYIFTILYFLVLFATDRRSSSNETWYTVLTVLLYPLGYLLMHIEDRYVWVDDVLLYVLSAFVLNALLEKSRVTQQQQTMVMTLVALFIIASPLHHLWGSLNADKDSYIMSKEIKERLHIGGKNVAAQADTDQGETWRNSLYLSYHLGDRYFGVVKKDEADEEVQEELLKNHIHYYFVDGKLKNCLGCLKLEMRERNISIYRVDAPVDHSLLR